VRQPPGVGFRILNALRQTLPYWAPIPLLVLFAIGIAWWRSKTQRAVRGVASNKLLNWIPGASRIQFQERCSRFAASLGALLDNRVPFAEALQIAADASGDTNLRLGAESLAADPNGRMPSDDSPVAQRFPPFLRWTIWHSESTTGRKRALEVAAQMYHEAAKRRGQRLRSLAPIALLVMLGGVVTLLNGLALFAPVTELLRTLARGPIR
jgi:general secretion pathway protein F